MLGLWLVVGLVLPFPGLLVQGAPARDSVNGDLWHTQLEAVYQRPDGTPVQLNASWDIWQPWPIPFLGYEGRLRNLQVSAGGEWQHNTSITFWLLKDDGFSLTFNVTIAADGFVWSQEWRWLVWSGCSLNQVDGTSTARFATLHGLDLQPALASQPFVGVGIATKTGPGDDHFYECWPGPLG